MNPHRHDSETGEVILEEDTRPSPEEAAASAVRAASADEAAAEIRIAEIEAATAIELAKLERSSLLDEERIELEALRAECEMLRAAAAPEPEPEPIVLPPAAPADDGPPADAPPPVEGSPEPAAPKRKSGLGMW